MTYSVPYAFVPGTKAKADEVNANFNDVINKLQETNNQVNENYNTLTENYNILTENCSNLTNSYNTLNATLSNTNTTLATKAKASDLDGIWTSRQVNLANAVQWAVGTTTKTYSLSSYLPNDNNIYEVLISGDGNSGATSGSAISCQIVSTYASNNCMLYRTSTRANASVLGGGCCIIPIGKDKNITLKVTATGSKTGNTYLYLIAYRKVR
jgi:hypothetical protein